MMASSGAQIRQPEWEKRIRRAAVLGERLPQAAEVLNFYGQILEFQQKIGTDSSSKSISRDANLALRERIEPDTVLPYLPALLKLVERRGPSKLAEQARMIGMSSEDEQQDLIREFLSRNDDDQLRSHSFFALALLQPYAECLGLTYPPQPPGSAGSACPLCNSRPQAAVLRPEGDGGKRFLLCSLCLTEWEFRRVLCPVCGEENYQKLPRYSAEDLIAVRVEACDTCHYYVKSIDMTVDGRAVPLVDEVATASLDLWAAEQGYKKAERNIMGF